MKNKGEIVAFNAGEFGEEALARTDLENYPRGAETMENILPLVQGGMTKMPGTIFVAETPSSNEGELRPFIFSETVKMALEFTDDKLRIVVDGGLLALEGGAATVGTFSDESGAAPTGGGTAPSGGTGEVDSGETDWFDFGHIGSA